MCALKIALWKVVDAINQMKLRGFWAQPCDGLWELCKSRPWKVTINHHHHRHHNHHNGNDDNDGNDDGDDDDDDDDGDDIEGE